MLDSYYSKVPTIVKSCTKENLIWECNFLFGDVNLSGCQFLDIGGGAGLASFYAACAGASEVICLEPESDGCTQGIRRDFDEISSALGTNNTHLVNSTFQAYEAKSKKFGAVFLNASINHLDEPACVDILTSNDARNTYISLFRRMADLTQDNGLIIASDVSRHNVFSFLGLKNPIAPTIEWHKHQSPSTWAKLLREAGYEDIKITWYTPRRLGAAGRVLLGNAAIACMMMSRFRVLARKLPKKA